MISTRVVGVADYIVSGGWSKKAVDEARKYGKANVVNAVSDKYTGKYV